MPQSQSNTNQEESQGKMQPRWIKCPMCDDYWCTLHEMHVADCGCVPVDILYEIGVDPYVDP